MGVHWINHRRKAELEVLCDEFGLDTGGLVEDLRNRFREFASREDHHPEVLSRLAEVEAQFCTGDRKLNVKPQSSGSTDPIYFIEQIETRAATYRLSLETLPPMIAILLTGRAESWRQTSGYPEMTWVDFKYEFLEFFLSPRYFEKLEDSIRARMLEPYKEYLPRRARPTKLVHENQLNATQNQKKYYDLKLRDWRPSIGSMVMLKQHVLLRTTEPPPPLTMGPSPIRRLPVYRTPLCPAHTGHNSAAPACPPPPLSVPAASAPAATAVPAAVAASAPAATAVPAAAATSTVPADAVPSDYVSAMRAAASLAAPATGPDADPWEEMPALVPSVSTAAAAITPATSASPSLDEQLGTLQKQHELLQLQHQILKLQQGIDEFQAPRQQVSDVSVIESMVARFSADTAYDVKKWLNDLEDAFEILQLNDRLRLVACRRMLEGTAAVLLRTVSVHSYEELKAILLREFGRSCSIEEVYHALRGRRIKAGEGCLRFAIEMQEIAMNAPIPENELVDLIIDGLRDNSTRVGMLYSARTMAELKPLLERYERLRMQAAASRQSNSVKAQPTTTAVAPGNKSSGTVTSETRCFNCSGWGHYKSQCPKPMRPPNSCFKCGIVGHSYKNPMPPISLLPPPLMKREID
ncbi:uncharacterized protein [Drosophila tropicalis]|uniref:uncharacterized protein n=1 Tax=Drosophila tropicalis TaxID=46794 RepID=UPI0035ABBABF